MLEMELSHINAESLVDGNVLQVLDLVDIFGEIGQALSGVDSGEMNAEHGNQSHTKADHSAPSMGGNSRMSERTRNLEAFKDESYSFQPTEALRQSSPQPGQYSASKDYDDFDVRSFSYSAEDKVSPLQFPPATTSANRRPPASSTTATSEVKDDIGEFLADRARQRSKGKGRVGADSSGTENANDEFRTPPGTRKRLRFDMTVRYLIGNRSINR